VSLYSVQKLLFGLNRDPAVRARYETDFEELEAVRKPDIGLLYVMGVNGQILMHYAALRGFEWDAYIAAMREGEQRYGPVRTGLYQRARTP